MTGRQLFAREHREAINESTTERMANGGHQNTAAVYQTVLKDMWSSLAAEAREAWDVRAAAEANNVAQCAPFQCSDLTCMNSLITTGTRRSSSQKCTLYCANSVRMGNSETPNF